jgi:hypothetical protein
LNAVKGLVVSQISGQMSISDDFTLNGMNAKERRATTFRLDRNHTAGHAFLLDQFSHFGDGTRLKQDISG